MGISKHGKVIILLNKRDFQDIFQLLNHRGKGRKGNEQLIFLEVDFCSRSFKKDQGSSSSNLLPLLTLSS
jgi:hypothetical protein